MAECKYWEYTSSLAIIEKLMLTGVLYNIETLRLLFVEYLQWEKCITKLDVIEYLPTSIQCKEVNSSE